MNAERLLAHYDRIADAPDAVPRLRRFILDLAVRGKLVEQDPNDVSQDRQLEEARKRLQDVAKRTRRLRRRPSSPITPGEIQQSVPGGWVPTRLNDTGLYVNGLAFKPADWKQTGFPIVRIQNLTDRSKEFNYASGEFPDEVIVQAGDILVAWSATLDAFIWNRQEAVLNQHIFRVLPDEGLTTRRFLYLLLRHAIRHMAESERAHGLVMKHINRGPFLAYVVLVPPLAEQHRIVAKVDELVVLCNRLEAARTERETTRDRLAAAALARLNAPDPDPAVFRKRAAAVLDNLTPLTTRSDQVKALRQTIINLAVRGRLVEQDPDDEPASELLRQIAAEKAQLARKKKIKGRRVGVSANYADVPFDLPSGWCPAKVGQILLELRTGPFGTALHESDYQLGGTPVINPASIGKKQIIPIKKMAVGPITLRRLAAFKLRSGDIVMGRRGEMGRCAVVSEHEKGWLCGTGSLVLRVPRCIFPRYLCMLIQSPFSIQYLSRTAVGATMQNLNQGILLGLSFGLPPFSEQHRIVTKVDELMTLCERLEASLTAGDDTRCCVLGALLSEALESTADGAATA